MAFMIKLDTALMRMQNAIDHEKLAHEPVPLTLSRYEWEAGLSMLGAAMPPAFRAWLEDKPEGAQSLGALAKAGHVRFDHTHTQLHLETIETLDMQRLVVPPDSIIARNSLNALRELVRMTPAEAARVERVRADEGPGALPVALRSRLPTRDPWYYGYA